VLKSLGVGHIVLAGVLTSGVVLSTVREAADLDYVITVLEDLCLDVDAEVQDVLMKKLFPLQGTVVTAEKFVEGLNA
jgi:nicotinamidase-related amidase